MYRGDLARDGHPPAATLDVQAVSRLGPSWQAHLDGAVDGTPAVIAGLVIAGSAGGTLAAFDARTGATMWARHGLGAIADSPAVAGDRVFVGTLTGRVYASHISGGDAIWDWSAPPNAAVWASPVAYRDLVIVGVSSPYGDIPLVPGRLFGLDAATGRVRWTVCVRIDCAPGDGVWSTPAIDGHGVAFVGVGNPDDGVLAFDPSTGARKWLASLYPDRDLDLDVGAAPMTFELEGREVVAQAAVEGLFAVLDAATGAFVWSREIVKGSGVHGLIASPAYDGSALYAGSASPPTGMYALSPADGSVRWRRDTGQPVYSAPAVAKGLVLFGTGAVFGDLGVGSLLAVSASDGHVLWSRDVHSAVHSGPAIAGDLVVVGDNAGEVMAFRPNG